MIAFITFKRYLSSGNRHPFPWSKLLRVEMSFGYLTRSGWKEMHGLLLLSTLHDKLVVIMSDSRLVLMDFYGERKKVSRKKMLALSTYFRQMLDPFNLASDFSQTLHFKTKQTYFWSTLSMSQLLLLFSTKLVLWHFLSSSLFSVPLQKDLFWSNRF